MIPIYGGSDSYTIEVKARRFAYEPDRIIVNQGDRITFKVTTLDITHGFYIDGYDVDLLVEPGKESVVTIVADKPGKFKIRCSVTCGYMHPFMVGELVVVENGINIVFVLSILIALLTALVSMYYVWKRW
jgi:heme/copper-type cytochrome/quinol oxidase subunit 2